VVTDRSPRPTRRSSWPRPFTPRLAARPNYLLHLLLTPNALYRRLAHFIEAHSWSKRSFIAAEEAVKERAFGCRMCGQCALPKTGYACPQTCPKQLRNGPCGGVSVDGACEVFPDLKCVWVEAYERCEETGHLDDLSLIQHPIDHRLIGSSSWLNYWQGRDEGLWTEPEGSPRRLPIVTAGRAVPQTAGRAAK
jgi:Methylene-tetrahydrofolate reductase C terminal